MLWTRLLSLVFGATVYAFSLILAVFLFGLGIGSSIGAAIARGSTRPRVALGWCQMMLCGAMGWAAYMLLDSLPYWPVNPSITGDPWLNFQLDIVRCLWVVLPGAILWGASFPLALAAVAKPGQDPGRLVGGVYAANTVGAIFGSLGSSLLIVVYLHTQRGQQLLIVVSALSALMLLAPAVAANAGMKSLRWVGTVVLILATGTAGLLARSVPAIPGVLVAYGRFAATWVGLTDIIYVGEGLNAFVAVSRTPTGVLNYHNAGKVQASSEPQDMRLQRMLGHFTHLIPKNPANALVIGCGAGVTAGAVSIGPGVKHETIAEIEPLVPASVSKYFGDYNYHVVDNPKVTVHIDDARHFLLTTNEKFDAITSDPLDPWVKGAATLYTAEFFDIVKKHLNPGGVVTLFVQLYESNTEATKSEIGTFLGAFPHGIVWGNTNNGEGLRSGADGAGRRHADQHRRDAGEARQSGIRAGDAVAARNRDQLGDRIALELRRIGVRSRTMAQGRVDQSRSESAPAVSCGARPESLSERPDLRGYDSVHEVPGTSVHRIGGVHPGRARRD